LDAARSLHRHHSQTVSSAMQRIVQIRQFASTKKLLSSEEGVIAAALALGAYKAGGWTKAELKSHSKYALRIPTCFLRELRTQICEGADPLGAAFCALRTPAERRPKGAV
jgi:hypothetical protein